MKVVIIAVSIFALVEILNNTFESSGKRNIIKALKKIIKIEKVEDTDGE